MEEKFDIEKFNIIEDDENYYFLRSLEPGDNEDIESGIIIDENGNFTRMRTDRERYDENPKLGTPKYRADSEVNLEEMFDHIKMHYRPDTNCISFSSNANVALSYGRITFSDKYVMVKVPKREMGDNIYNAGQYMLTEVKKQVEQAIQEKIEQELTNETLLDETKEKLEQIKRDLQEIEEVETLEEIRELIKVRYKSETLDINRTGIIYNSGNTIKAPHSRINRYNALSEEQNLEKNKIIAKLTVLEQRGIIEPLIPNTANNKNLIATIGSAFSSSEVIHYGDIEGENLIEIQPEIVDIFAILQQAENENQEIVSRIKREILEYVISGKRLEIPETSTLKRADKIKNDITIEEMYEITEGTVEYGEASSIVKNLFYLARSQVRAKEFVRIIREITNNNPEYEEILNYIEHNGFEIEPEIITRQSDNKGYSLSESVSLDIKNSQLIEQVKDLTEEEQIAILENGGLSNVQKIITNNFAKVQRAKKIDKEEYYSEAIISLYDWEKIGIHGFTIAEKNNLVQRLKNEYCLELYQKLEAKGINKENISRILLNIVKRKNDFEITEEDAEETIKQKRLKQYDKLIENVENIEELNDELSIEGVERFLGYYDIGDSKIQLKSYQQEAVDKTDKIFEKRRYASVILPTGGGKSYVALDELLKHKEEKMLYLAPTNEILEHIKDVIVEYHGLKGTVNKSKAQIVAEVFPNLKFMTYPSLLSKEGREAIKEEYNFIVFDELHRTGAEKWGKKIDILLKNQSEETRVLGITATPRRDSDGRDMSNEIAEKLGYANKEAVRGDHIAMNLSLVNAIRMGIVVNPKLVSCEYDLIKEGGDLDQLEERIKNISDINKRDEELKKYEKLRRSLEHAKGVPEILQENVKAGGKYIVFLPVADDIEDEDGNKIGRKKGKSKIADYEKQFREYFEGSGIELQFNSMLGEYGDKENQRQLEEFQNSKDTRFMLVMNKANEGLHVEGIKGIIWLRPLDENSRILYLQQLGRTIYPENSDNPTKDEERPVVIDLVNNTMRVDWQNEVTEKDDIQMLNLILDWSKIHGENLPDINSSDREESGYAKVLKEIQKKYSKYLSGKFDLLNDEQIEEIKIILELGKQIDLWGIELPDKKKRKRIPGEKNSKSTYIDDFKLTGLLSDFVELEKEVEEIEEQSQSLKNALEIEAWCKNNFENKEKYERRLPNSKAKKTYEKNLEPKLRDLNRNIVKQYEGKELDEIEDAEHRQIVETMRKLEYEQELGKKLGNLRLRIVKQYEGKELDEIENAEDRQIVKIIRELDENYGLGDYLKNVLEIEAWCKNNFENKEKYERRLPNSKAKKTYEKNLDPKLKDLIKQYEGKKLDEIEDAKHRQIVEIIRKLEYEQKLGQKLSALRQNIVKQYEGQKLDEIKNAEHRQIVKIIRELDENYGLGDSLKNALEIEAWCKNNFENKEKYERRLPNATSKKTYVKNLDPKLKDLIKQYEGKKLDEIEDAKHRQIVEIIRKLEYEQELGRKLNYLKQDIVKQYEGKELYEIENAEHRQIVEIIRKLDKEYGLGDSLKNALEIKAWCKNNFENKEKYERRLPNSKAKRTYEKNLDPKLKGLIKQYEGKELDEIENAEHRQIVETMRKLEYEQKLGKKLGNLRQNIVKQYEGKELDEIEDAEHRQIVKIIRELDEKYNYRKRTSKEIAEASISSIKDENATKVYDELLEESGVKEKAEVHTDEVNQANQSSDDIDVPE